MKKSAKASTNPEKANVCVLLVKVLILMIGKFFLVSDLHSSCCSGRLFYPSVLRRSEGLPLK